MERKHHELPELFLEAHRCQRTLDPSLRFGAARRDLASPGMRLWRSARARHQRISRNKEALRRIMNELAADSVCGMCGLRRKL